jgi:hypothetical protein
MRSKVVFLFSLLIMAALITACGGAPDVIEQPSATAPAPTKPPTLPPPTDTPVPPTETPIPKPPAPEAVTFTTEDGVTLNGMYYAAAIQPAPLVIFIHWVAGDLHDWDAIAPWLQKGEPFVKTGWVDANIGLRRGDSNPPYLDSSWFPPVPQELNVGVLTFTLRGCKPSPIGCESFAPGNWYKDTKAAFEYGATLTGVDPQRIIGIGASIGADGAAEGCLYLNQSGKGNCLGSIALSPGDYYPHPYKQVINDSDKDFPNTTNVCMADGKETEWCRRWLGPVTYEVVDIVNGSHGPYLLVPDGIPNALQVILDYLVAWTVK